MVEHSAVNRRVASSNLARGANSLCVQRVASIFGKLCRLAMQCRVHESRVISINKDEGKLTRACVFEVDQLNRGEWRSNQTFGSQPNADGWPREPTRVSPIPLAPVRSI